MKIDDINNRIIAHQKMPMADRMDLLKKGKGRSLNNDISFKDMISHEINKLNHSQIKADRINEDFIAGNVDDLHDVLITTEEARLSLELAVQIRNKCIEAYKEINSIQL